jgi:hypothetical protein
VEVFPDSNASLESSQRVFVKLVADADGRFFHKEQVRWVMHLVPGDVFGARLLVRARSGGEESPPKKLIVRPGMELFGLWRERQKSDLGDLTLEPLPP